MNISEHFRQKTSDTGCAHTMPKQLVGMWKIQSNKVFVIIKYSPTIVAVIGFLKINFNWIQTLKFWIHSN